MTRSGTSGREVLTVAVARLAAAQIESARVDAEWLLADTLQTGRMSLYDALDRKLSRAECDRFEAAIQRRAAREPLQQILGWEDFHGVRVRVTPDVLVPRPETEALTAWVLELLAEPRMGATPRVIDLGTGSGCIACALARQRPDAEVIAVEVSPAAAAVAWANVNALGLTARVRVVVGDLLSALRPIDAELIVSNPPYLPSSLVETLHPEVRDHEPRLALDGGADGLAVIDRIVRAARPRLRRGGALALETGGGEQAGQVAAMMREAGFVDVALRRDLAGVPRLVCGRA